MAEDSAKSQQEKDASGADRSPGRNTEEERLLTGDESGTWYTEYDPDQDTVAMTVILALEEITGCEPTDLPPLSDYIDPDALNRLFGECRATGMRHGSTHFTFFDHRVSIYSDGQILISLQGEE